MEKRNGGTEENRRGQVWSNGIENRGDSLQLSKESIVMEIHSHPNEKPVKFPLSICNHSWTELASVLERKTEKEINKERETEGERHREKERVRVRQTERETKRESWRERERERERERVRGRERER